MNIVEKEDAIISHYSKSPREEGIFRNNTLVLKHIRSILKSIGVEKEEADTSSFVSLDRKPAVSSCFTKEFLGDNYENIIESFYSNLFGVVENVGNFFSNTEVKENIHNKPILNSQDLLEYLEIVLEEVQNQISNNEIHRYFDENKKEVDLHPLVKFMMMSYCNLKDIIINREPKLEDGYCDLSFAKNISVQCLIEIKKHGHSKTGVEQIIRYMDSCSIKHGIVLILAWEDDISNYEEKIDKAIAENISDGITVKKFILRCKKITRPVPSEA